MKFWGRAAEQSQIVPCNPGAPHLIWGRAARSWWAPAGTKLALSFVPGSLTTQHPQLGHLDIKLSRPTSQPHLAAPKPGMGLGVDSPAPRALSPRRTASWQRCCGASARRFRVPGVRPHSWGSLGLLPINHRPSTAELPALACHHCLGPWLTGAGIILDEAVLNL